MEKNTGETIGSILSEREILAIQTRANHEKREEMLNAEYNRLIVPLEKSIIGSKVPTELWGLLNEFARRAESKLRTSFVQSTQVDWDKEKEDVLKLFREGNLKESDASVTVSYSGPVIDLNTGGPYLFQGREPKIYSFGIDVDPDGRCKVSLANNHNWAFDGSRDNFIEIANNLADFLDVKTLRLDRSNPDTPEMRLFHNLSSALTYHYDDYS